MDRANLEALIVRLRKYVAPALPIDDDEKDGGAGSGDGEPPGDEPHQLRKASVLICIFSGDEGELRVLLTKRAPTLSTHSGDVALPGGKADEGDADDVATALREAHEEIGLNPELVTVATCLETIYTKRYLLIVPVIAVLLDKQAFKPAINEAEVEAIFDAPLEMFLKDENRTCAEREWLGKKYMIQFFDYQFKDQKFLIWGLTAGILIRAASVVYQRPAAFEGWWPQFKVPRHLSNTLPALKTRSYSDRSMDNPAKDAPLSKLEEKILDH